MTQRFGQTTNRPKFFAVGARGVTPLVAVALMLAPGVACAAERGLGALSVTQTHQQPNFGVESRVSAARQPAFLPESARDMPTQARSDMAPEGRLRLRPMALQQGF